MNILVDAYRVPNTSFNNTKLMQGKITLIIERTSGLGSNNSNISLGENDNTGGSALPGSRLGAGILSDRKFASLASVVSESTLKVSSFIYVYMLEHAKVPHK